VSEPNNRNCEQRVVGFNVAYTQSEAIITLEQLDSMIKICVTIGGHSIIGNSHEEQWLHAFTHSFQWQVWRPQPNSF
jgi:hypothetical protein